MLYVILLIVVFCGLYTWLKPSVKNVAILPNHHPILGHCVLLKEDVFSLVKKLGLHSVENDGISAVLFGPVPIYVISDPVKATVVLSTCLEKAFFYKLIKPFFGDTLLSATVPDWKRNRRILDLAFKPQVLEGYLTVFNTQAARLLTMIDDKADQGSIDLTEDIARNVLETACQTTMGMQPNDQDYFNSRYVKAIHKVFEIITLRVQKPWMFFDFIFFFCSARREMDEALETIFETSSKMVRLRKSENLERLKNGNKSTETTEKLSNYLDIVIENSMTNEASLFSDVQLRYLCDNMLLAAFDTTTYELLFTLVCIGSDEEVQRKIFHEINEVLGTEEVVRKEHLRKLIYLEAAIKEAIRLYPIGPVVARQATEAVHLDNIKLPAASVLVVHLWGINRNKKYWGDDAEEYNPDRWLNPSTLPEHPNAFASFSFGRRNCIGKLYTMMHMKTTLVPILRKYRIRAEHNKMEFTCLIMLKAKAGHLVKLELR